MGLGWGHSVLTNYRSQNQNKSGIRQLETAISNLSPKARQAMYVASSEGLIARKTWNGCAFNAGGKVVGVEDVGSTRRAAEVFEMSREDVATFIHTWDNFRGSAEYATDILHKLLSGVNLFEGKKTTVTLLGVHSERVFQSETSKMREEFDNIVSGIDFDNPEPEHVEFVNDVNTAAELIFA